MNSETENIHLKNFKERLKQGVHLLNERYQNLTGEIDTHHILKDCIQVLDGRLFGWDSQMTDHRERWFVRVRRASKLTSESQWSDPKQFSYPPPEVCTSLGRAHVPYHPVFYCSDSYEGAIREMKTPEEDWYYVSLWYSPNINLTQFNILMGSNLTAPRLLEKRDQAIKDMRKQFAAYGRLSNTWMIALGNVW